MTSEPRIFVGIDWASKEHQVCVLDAEGRKLRELTVEHSGAGLFGLVEKILELADDDASAVAVGIEVPRGPVVETCLDRGLVVYSLNPKQMDRFRDRFSPAGAKDDRRDAYVIADSLRTDRSCYRSVQADDPLIIQLREIDHADDDLAQELNRVSNRLRDQLFRFFPQVLELCKAADEPWFWDLLERAPNPAAAQRLRRPQVVGILKEHRIRRIDADQVLEVLKVPAVRVSRGTTEAASLHIALLIPQLRLIHKQRQHCAKKFRALLDHLGRDGNSEGQKGEHRDVDIILSMPGIGITVAATMLAEASSALRDRDYSALRTHAGLAPVTRASGLRRQVNMRRACNHRLRNACYHWARTAAQWDPASKAAYASLRRRGHNHARALRTVADRLLAVLCAMLRDATPYDASKRKPPVRVAA